MELKILQQEEALYYPLRDGNCVAWYNGPMNINGQSIQPDLRSKFYQPLEKALERAGSKRNCTDYTDAMFLLAGVGRVIEAAKSGRAWVQHLLMLGTIIVSVRNFFLALESKRRLRLLIEVDHDIRTQVNLRLKERGDPFANIPELAGYEFYASDGHSHGASAHEAAILGKKRAVNHIYCLNLRSEAMSHLALTEPAKGKKKEHEITALKHLGGQALRMGAPKGIKVIHVYDPAIIDYREWYKWKQGSGVYIITREKSNSAFMVLGIHQWDKTDRRNAGVTSDELVGTSNGVSIRRIGYTDPVSGIEYSFITNEMMLPPGIIAFIYKIRWNVEKVYDEFKNIFYQQQAWGKSSTTKCQQALFLVITHNLLVLLEHCLDVEEGIVDEKVRKKHARHIAAGIAQAHSEFRLPNELVVKFSRITKRSLQFVRWLQLGLITNPPWQVAVEQLRPLMLKYLI